MSTVDQKKGIFLGFLLFFTYGAVFSQPQQDSLAAGKKRSYDIRLEGKVSNAEGSPLDQVSVLVKNKVTGEEKKYQSKRDGDFAFKLSVNNIYDISISRNDYKTKKLLFDARLPESGPADKSVRGFVFSLRVSLLNAADKKPTAVILNQPDGKIQFNVQKQNFESDREYAKKIEKDLASLTETVSNILSQSSQEKATLEIAKFKAESELKEKQIELLQKDQELKEAVLKRKEMEILNSNLENDKKAKELALINKEKEVQGLKFSQQKNELIRQRLEADKKAKELEILGQAKLIEEVKTEATQSMHGKEVAESEKKSVEQQLIDKDKQILELHLKLDRLTPYLYVLGSLVVLLLFILIYRIAKEKNRTEGIGNRQ